MRRLLSTLYRLILASIALVGVTFSILSATSCDFLDFVHPYETNGRFLARNLQNETTPEEVTTPSTTVGLVNTDYLAQLADSIAAVGNVTVDEVGGVDVDPASVGADETVVSEGDGTDEDTSLGAGDADGEAGDVPDASVTPVDSTDELSTVDIGTDGLDEASLGAEDEGDVSDASVTPVDSTGEISTVDIGTDGLDEATVTQSTGIAMPTDSGVADAADSSTEADESSAETPAVDTADSSTGIDAEDVSSTSNFPINGENETDTMEITNKTDSESPTNDLSTNIPSNAYGEDVPNIALSGSAGLFCEANDISILDIWKGTFLDSELAIDEESNHDESEDIARNAAVVSITFGALIAIILILESILGWKMCCEKWIVGLLALMACISQGVTFLFFNSERYCNANIIHEILEQKPCVVGSGGTLSVGALIIYASLIILVCCAPQADPYHLLCCCRAQKASDPNFSSLELTENKSAEGTMEQGGNVALSGRDHSGAPWMSEEEKEKKENEII